MIGEETLSKAGRSSAAKRTLPDPMTTPAADNHAPPEAVEERR
jgi:hypothetical protein